MKRFGGFLIETGIISVEQLAQALLAQIKDTPASVVILADNGYLDAQQVIDILSLQNEAHIDFPSACRQLKLWQTEYSEIIRKKVLKNRPLLGQIMLEKGWIIPQKIMAELHRFQDYFQHHNSPCYLCVYYSR